MEKGDAKYTALRNIHIIKKKNTWNLMFSEDMQRLMEKEISYKDIDVAC